MPHPPAARDGLASVHTTCWTLAFGSEATQTSSAANASRSSQQGSGKCGHCVCAPSGTGQGRRAGWETGWGEAERHGTSPRPRRPPSSPRPAWPEAAGPVGGKSTLNWERRKCGLVCLVWKVCSSTLPSLRFPFQKTGVTISTLQG